MTGIMQNNPDTESKRARCRVLRPFLKDILEKGEMKRMKPHVIMIMADQLRADVLGKGFTPNIDAIAKEGVKFDRAYCGCPLCVPARGVIFTGTYPNRNGSLINPWEPQDAKYGNVKSGITNLYELMEEEWDSIHSGKQHLFTEGGKLEDRKDSKTRWLSTEQSYKEYLKENEISMPGGPSFRMRVPELISGKATHVANYSNANTGRYEPGEEYYFDHYFAKKAVEGIRERDPLKPLLLNAMFLAPHPPLEIPDPWYSLVKDTDFDLPGNVGVYYSNQSPLQMYNLPGVVGACYNRAHWKEAWRVYLGLAAMLDNCVGQIQKELKAQGIYEESLIIFTSDHGEMLGSHGLFQKMCMYEEAARVPLYIKFPKERNPGRPGQVIKSTVSHVDLMPTLCDYLELKPGHGMDGESLMPLISGNDKPDKGGRAFLQYDGNGSLSNFQRCVVRGNHKLILDFFKNEVYYELYDLDHDRQETCNLLFQPEYDSLAREMAAELARHMTATGDHLDFPAFSPERFRKAYGGRT